jgi:uncharacterized membrane protein YphA (DoxX/SURF4 family)
MEKLYKKILVEFCRVFLGVVFVFSGFVKAVDPWGSTYKILDYFTAFNLSFFDFTGIPIAFIQSAIEFAVGICLLLGVYRRINTFLALLIMLFMTPLTLYLAIANPVTDCGCFGDALVITNWQTFSKNLFLLAAAIILFIWKRKITPFFTHKSYSLVSLWVYLFILGVSVYCFTWLPILDFRPYKVGANIPQLMTIPEGAEQPVYETTLIYSRDGEPQEFTLENYPKNDESWTFVDSKPKLIKKGYEPPIHDFSIITEEGDDVTEEVLHNPSYTFLLITHKLEKADDANVDKINEIYDYAKASGYDFYALTASLPEKIREWTQNTGAEYPFCIMDDVMLKTIIRSNPGLLLLKDGTIINKWPENRLPNFTLNKSLEDTDLGQIPKKHNVLNVLFLTLILLIPLVVLFLFDFFYYRKKQIKQDRRKSGTNHRRNNEKTNQ